MEIGKRIFAATLLMALMPLSTHASITKGALILDDNAFADAVTASGTLPLASFSGPPPSTLEEAILGSDLSKAVGLRAEGDYLDLSFVDNSAVNGSGADIVFWEIGAIAEAVGVTINGITMTVQPEDPSFTEGYEQAAGFIDLSDFGIMTGGSVSSLRLSFLTVSPSEINNPTVSGIAAINNISVPEPATLALFGLGLAGIPFVRRRRTPA